jgi:hypothetical protein
LVGDFSLQARARTGHDFLNWGPAISVRTTPATTPPELRLSVTSLPAGQLELDINVASGGTPTGLTIESRDALSSSWQSDPATVQTLSGTQFRAVVTPVASSRTRFYRVRAN